MLFRRHQEAAETATWGMLLGFAAALVLLIVVLNAALSLAWRLTLPMASAYPALFFQTNTAVVLLFVLGGCWVESLRLREGGAHVARLAGARPADTTGRTSGSRLERRLVNVVQEIALAARARPPAAWVLPRDQSINAFAAGWTPDDALIAVTQGALERLTRAELQGLVGHEMGHVVSGDMRLHMRLIGLVWGLQMVHGFGRSLAARDEHGRVHAGAIVGVVLIVVGYAGWLAGRVLQAGVARQREFRADAAAVQYARTVDGIGGVLRKIAGLPQQPRPRPPASLAHLWIAESPSGGRFRWRRWLATHPPIALRLQRLYGRPMEALDAPLLSLPTEDEPMLAMAPAAEFAPEARIAAPPQHPPAMPLADPQDERDALQRAAFWRSRGECHAALLAWLIADDGAAAPWAQWQEIAGNQPFVERLRADWLALGAGSRWQLFDALVARTRGTSATDRAALIGAARHLAPRGATRLRLMLLRRALRAAPPRRGRMALEDLMPAFAAATASLAQTMGPGGAAWAAAVRVPPIEAPKLVTPRHAFALRHLHPMQSPRVARAWGEAAARSGLSKGAEATQCLVAACRVLDTPAPQSLLRLQQMPTFL